MNNQLLKKLAIKALWALRLLLTGTSDAVCGSLDLEMPE